VQRLAPEFLNCSTLEKGGESKQIDKQTMGGQHCSTLEKGGESKRLVRFFLMGGNCSTLEKGGESKPYAMLTIVF